jgi:hypothetical protein
LSIEDAPVYFIYLFKMGHWSFSCCYWQGWIAVLSVTRGVSCYDGDGHSFLPEGVKSIERMAFLGRLAYCMRFLMTNRVDIIWSYAEHPPVIFACVDMRGREFTECGLFQVR